eukprot:Clim_evm35s148 gene=Clim_evmTU35s148
MPIPLATVKRIYEFAEAREGKHHVSGVLVANLLDSVVSFARDLKKEDQSYINVSVVPRLMKAGHQSRLAYQEFLDLFAGNARSRSPSPTSHQVFLTSPLTSPRKPSRARSRSPPASIQKNSPGRIPSNASMQSAELNQSFRSELADLEDRAVRAEEEVQALNSALSYKVSDLRAAEQYMQIIANVCRMDFVVHSRGIQESTKLIVRRIYKLTSERRSAFEKATHYGKQLDSVKKEVRELSRMLADSDRKLAIAQQDSARAREELQKARTDAERARKEMVITTVRQQSRSTSPSQVPSPPKAESPVRAGARSPARQGQIKSSGLTENDLEGSLSNILMQSKKFGATANILKSYMRREAEMTDELQLFRTRCTALDEDLKLSQKQRDFLKKREQETERLIAELRGELDSVREELDHLRKQSVRIEPSPLDVSLESTNRLTEVETMARRLKNELSIVNQEKHDLTAQRDVLQDKVTEMHSQLAAARETIAGQETQITDLMQEIASVDDSKLHLEAKLQKENQKLAKDINELSSKVASGQNIHRELGEKVREVRKLETHLSDSKALVEELRNEVETLEKKVKLGEEQRVQLQVSARQAQSELQATKDALVNMRDNQASLETRAETLQSQHGLLKAKTIDQQSRLAELLDKTKEQQVLINSLTDRSSSLEARTRTAEKARRTAEDRITELEGQLETSDRDLDRVRSDLLMAQRGADAAEQRERDMESMTKQQLTERDEMIAHLRADLEGVLGDRDMLEKRLHDTNRALDATNRDLKKSNDRATYVEDKMKALSTEHQTNQRNLHASERNVNSLKSDVSRLEGEVKDFKRENDKLVAELDQKTLALAKQNENFKILEREKEADSRQLKLTEEELRAMQNAMRDMEQMMKTYQTDLDTTRMDMRRFDGNERVHKEELDRMNERLSNLVEAKRTLEHALTQKEQQFGMDFDQISVRLHEVERNLEATQHALEMKDRLLQNSLKEQEKLEDQAFDLKRRLDEANSAVERSIEEGRRLEAELMHSKNQITSLSGERDRLVNAESQLRDQLRSAEKSLQDAKDRLHANQNEQSSLNTERMNIMREMDQLHVTIRQLEERHQLDTTAIERITAEATELRGQHERTIFELRNFDGEKSRLLGERDRFASDMNALKKELAQANGLIKEKEDQITVLKNQQRDLLLEQSRMKEQTNDQRHKIEILTRDHLNTSHNAEATQKDLLRVQAQLNDAKRAAEDITHAREAAVREAETQRRRAEELKQHYDDVLRKLDGTRDDIERMKQQVVSAERERDASKQELMMLHRNNQELSLRGNNLASRCTAAETQIRDLGQRLSEATSDITLKNRELSDLRRARDEDDVAGLRLEKTRLESMLNEHQNENRSLISQLDRMDRTIEDYKERLSQVETERNAASSSRESLTAELARESAALEGAKDTLDRLEKEVSRLQSELSSERSKVERNRDALSESEREVNNLKHKNETLTFKIEELRQTLQSHKDAETVLQQTVSSYETHVVRDLTTDLDETRTGIASLRSELSAARENLRTSAKERGEALSAKLEAQRALERCEARLNEVRAELTKERAEKQRLSGEKVSLQATIDRLGRELEKLSKEQDQSIRNKHDADGNFASLREKFESTEDLLSFTQASLEARERDLHEAEELHSRVVTELKSYCSELERKVESMTSQVRQERRSSRELTEELQASRRASRDAQNTVSKLTSALEQYETDIALLNERNAVLQRQLDETGQAIAEAKDGKSEMERTMQKVESDLNASVSNARELQSQVETLQEDYSSMVEGLGRQKTVTNELHTELAKWKKTAADKTYENDLLRQDVERHRQNLTKAYESHQKQRNDLGKEILDLHEELATVRREREAVQSDFEDASGQIESLETQLTAQKEAVSADRQRYREQARKVEELSSELLVKTRDLEALHSMLQKTLNDHQAHVAELNSQMGRSVEDNSGLQEQISKLKHVDRELRDELEGLRSRCQMLESDLEISRQEIAAERSRLLEVSREIETERHVRSSTPTFPSEMPCTQEHLDPKVKQAIRNLSVQVARANTTADALTSQMHAANDLTLQRMRSLEIDPDETLFEDADEIFSPLPSETGPLMHTFTGESGLTATVAKCTSSMSVVNTNLHRIHAIAIQQQRIYRSSLRKSDASQPASTRASLRDPAVRQSVDMQPQPQEVLSREARNAQTLVETQAKLAALQRQLHEEHDRHSATQNKLTETNRERAQIERDLELAKAAQVNSAKTIDQLRAAINTKDQAAVKTQKEFEGLLVSAKNDHAAVLEELRVDLEAALASAREDHELELTSLQSQLQDVQSKLRLAQDEGIRLQRTVNQLQLDTTTQSKKARQAESLKTDLENSFRGAQMAQEELEAKVHEYQDLLKSVLELCQLSVPSISDVHGLRSVLVQSVNDILNERNDLRTLAKETSQRADHMRQEVDKCRDDLTEMTTARDALQTDLQQANLEISAVKDLDQQHQLELRNIRESLQAADGRAKAAHKAREQAEEGVKGALEQKSIVERELATTKHQVESLRLQYESIEQERDGESKRITELTNARAMLEQKIGAMQRELDYSQKREKEQQDQLNDLRSSLATSQQKIRDEAFEAKQQADVELANVRRDLRQVKSALDLMQQDRDTQKTRAEDALRTASDAQNRSTRLQFDLDTSQERERQLQLDIRNAEDRATKAETTLRNAQSTHKQEQDMFKEQIRRLRKDLDEARDMGNGLRTQLETTVEAAEQSKNILQADLDAALSREQDLRSKYQGVAEEMEAMKASAIRSLQREVEDLKLTTVDQQEAMNRLQESNRQFQAELEAANDAKKRALQDLATAREAKRRLESAVQMSSMETQNTQAELNTSRANHDDELKRLYHEISSLKQELTDKEDWSAEAQRKILSLEASNKSLRNAQAPRKDEETLRSTLNQSTSSVQSTMEPDPSLAIENKTLQAEVQDLQIKVSAFKKVEHQLRRDLERKTTAERNSDQKRVAVQDDFEMLKNENEDLSKQVQGLMSELAEARNAERSSDTQIKTKDNEILRMKAKIEELQKESNTLREQIRGIREKLSHDDVLNSDWQEAGMALLSELAHEIKGEEADVTTAALNPSTLVEKASRMLRQLNGDIANMQQDGRLTTNAFNTLVKLICMKLDPQAPVIATDNTTPMDALESCRSIINHVHASMQDFVKVQDDAEYNYRVAEEAASQVQRLNQENSDLQRQLNSTKRNLSHLLSSYNVLEERLLLPGSSRNQINEP